MSVDATRRAASIRVRAAVAGPVPWRFQLDARGVGLISLSREGKEWTGLLPVGRWVGDKTTRPTLIERFFPNVRPRYKFFYPSMLERLGLPDKLTIISGRDTSRPTLDAFSFTPTAVDTTTQARR